MSDWVSLPNSKAKRSFDKITKNVTSKFFMQVLPLISLWEPIICFFSFVFFFIKRFYKFFALCVQLIEVYAYPSGYTELSTLQKNDPLKVTRPKVMRPKVTLPNMTNQKVTRPKVNRQKNTHPTIQK